MEKQEHKTRNFRSEAQSIARPTLVSTFGAKASGNDLSERELQKLEHDLPSIKTKMFEEEILLSGGSLDGVIARSGQINDQKRKLLERLKAQNKTESMAQFIMLLEQERHLQERLDWLDDEIGRLSYEIDSLGIEIAGLEASISALDNAIGRFRRTGDLELNSDGSLRDEVAEQALRYYERRTGLLVDRSDTETVYDALEIQSDYLGFELDRLESDRNDKRKQKDAHISEKGEVESDLERVGAQLDEIEVTEELVVKASASKLGMAFTNASAEQAFDDDMDNMFEGVDFEDDGIDVRGINLDMMKPR